MAFKPEFTPRIDLGHLIQAGLLVISVGGGLGTVFITLEDQIAAQSVLYAGISQQVVLQGKMIDQIEADQRHFSDTIDGALYKLSEKLSDLNVLVAKHAR